MAILIVSPLPRALKGAKKNRPKTEKAPSMFEDLWAYEIAIPGSITGQGDVACPNCGTDLVVPIEDPNGIQSYQCQRCLGAFEVEWGRN